VGAGVAPPRSTAPSRSSSRAGRSRVIVATGAAATAAPVLLVPRPLRQLVDVVKGDALVLVAGHKEVLRRRPGKERSNDERTMSGGCETPRAADRPRVHSDVPRRRRTGCSSGLASHWYVGSPIERRIGTTTKGIAIAPTPSRHESCAGADKERTRPVPQQIMVHARERRDQASTEHQVLPVATRVAHGSATYHHRRFPVDEILDVPHGDVTKPTLPPTAATAAHCVARSSYCPGRSRRAGPAAQPRAS
jgi:hypothetical protein